MQLLVLSYTLKTLNAPCTQLPFGSAISLGNTVLLVVKAKGYVYFAVKAESMVINRVRNAAVSSFIHFEHPMLPAHNFLLGEQLVWETQYY